MARGLRPSLLQRIRRSDRGAFLVEFAIVVPLLILLFGIIVEGGRLMWSYQTAAAGVRDAARYLGRIVPSDLCVTDAGNTSLGAYESSLRDRVAQDINSASVMPSMVTVTSVKITRETCNDNLRVARAAIVRVDATVEIEFPLRQLLQIVGGSFPSKITTTITDRTRVFGA